MPNCLDFHLSVNPNVRLPNRLDVGGADHPVTLLHALPHGILVSHIAPDDSRSYLLQRRNVAGFPDLADHLVLSLRQAPDRVRSDESRTARNERFHLTPTPREANQKATGSLTTAGAPPVVGARTVLLCDERRFLLPWRRHTAAKDVTV